MCLTAPPDSQPSSSTHLSDSPFKLRPDTPSDPATTGYTLNHFALIVNNMAATTHFYGTILGMRQLFSYQASPGYEIVYMGYPQTPDQTAGEMLAQKPSREGLLEFVCLKDSPLVSASTAKTNTFSHVGVMVPDVRATQARMREFGVKVLKGVGEGIETEGEIARGFGFEGGVEEAEAVVKGVEGFGFAEVLIVCDPDGNLVEIQQK